MAKFKLPEWKDQTSTSTHRKPPLKKLYQTRKKKRKGKYRRLPLPTFILFWFFFIVTELGTLHIIFQAKIIAIEVCLNKICEQAYEGQRIYIFSKSQAALKVLTSKELTSRRKLNYLIWKLTPLLNICSLKFSTDVDFFSEIIWIRFLKKLSKKLT